MLRQRTLVTLVVGPVLIWLILLGGWPYFALIAVMLSLAAVEFGRLFRRAGLRPAAPILVGAVIAQALTRYLTGFEDTPAVVTGVLLLSMTWHLVDYERGAPRSGTDFAVTVAGSLYLGWIGAYLISLRALPEGVWWVLLALPTVWIVDSAAYFAGSSLGRRKLAPRLSPKKTWEGYVAGVAGGLLSGAGLAALYVRLNQADPFGSGALAGLALGALLGALTPLGDLGISMIKRELQVKDTGTLLPGHGGALDRLDSWLWTAVLTYYAVGWLSGL